MKSFRYRINDGRTDAEKLSCMAGLLMKEAMRYSSSITLYVEEKTADAKRLFSFLGLGLKKADEIIVEADGPDEARAIVKMAEFFAENL